MIKRWSSIRSGTKKDYGCTETSSNAILTMKGTKRTKLDDQMARSSFVIFVFFVVRHQTIDSNLNFKDNRVSLLAKRGPKDKPTNPTALKRGRRQSLARHFYTPGSPPVSTFWPLAFRRREKYCRCTGGPQIRLDLYQTAAYSASSRFHQ